MFGDTNKLNQKRHIRYKRHSKHHRRYRYPERNWIQFLILRVLYEKPIHGYQLMEEMEVRGFVLPRRLESGAVYTALRRMERHGLLESVWEKVESGSDRRVYTVTEEGVKALKTGLKTMVEREALIKDLIAFYNKHIQKWEEEIKEADISEE